MRKVVLAVIGLVLTIGMAHATVPAEENCTVDPWDSFGGMITAPYDGMAPSSIVFTCNIRNSNNEAIPNAYVEVLFGTPGNHFFCNSAVLTGTTDANGDLTMAVSAGGCTMGTDAVMIRANNVIIRHYDNVKSADFNGTNGDGQVALTDFTNFGNAYVAGAPGCTDYFNDGSTGLTDFTAFGNVWGSGCE